MTGAAWPHLLGIVGGLGPHAHVEFERRLLKAAEPVGTEQGYPPWVLVSLPATPDRTAFILRGGPSPAPFLRQSLEVLAGRADFAVIACITAHAFLDEVRPVSPVPILDLVEATLGEVVARWGEGARVGVLATTGTLESGLFPSTAARLAPGLRVTSLRDLPDGERLQDAWVMRAIYGLKAGVDPETWARLTGLLRRAAGRLAEEGVDVVLTACTEIGMALAGGPAEGIELLDPLDVGARAALAVSRGERPLPGQDVMTLQRYAESMNVETKRATVYFDSDLHRALRFKAAETQRSVSELVNRAVRRALAEDADDLAAFDERRNEPSLSFEEVVQDLKRRGKL